MDVEWDDDNVGHLARHGITADEVEEVISGPTIRRRGGTDAPDRFRILGRTSGGRYLAVVCQGKSEGLIRPITGWEMGRSEREIYDRQIGER